MSVLHRLEQEVQVLPGLARFGLAVFSVGGVMDLIAHGAPPDWITALGSYLGPEGQHAHEVTFAGMVLILLGLVTRRPARPDDRSGGDDEQKGGG